MSRINLDETLKDYEGKPHTRSDARVDENNSPVRYPEDHPLAGQVIIEYKGPLKLRHVLLSAVDAVHRDEKLTLSESLKRGKLAERIKDPSQSEKNFSADDVKIMTDCVVKAQVSPSILLQVLRLIDPHHEELKEPAKEGPQVERK